MAILNQPSSSLRMKTLTKSSVSFKVVVDEAELCGMMLASRNQAVRTKLSRHSRLLTDIISQILAPKSCRI
jgi:hypothetical protein